MNNLQKSHEERILKTAIRKTGCSEAKISGYSLIHSHCGLPMIKVKLYFDVQMPLLKLLGFKKFQKVPEFFCANPDCNYHSSFHCPGW